MTDIDISALEKVIGHELELGQLSTTISHTIATSPAATVGAVHVTCADEAQHRVIEKVQELIIEPHVTPMASGQRTAFRLVNLGGYHETGALGIAEDHWAGAHDPATGPKLMFVRVDAHVGVDDDPAAEPIYGHFVRFGRPSVACGALAAILHGHAMAGGGGFVDHHVRARRILEAFPEHNRMLAAAICRAELSAADCRNEILTSVSHDTPTVWLIVATVTLNHSDRHASMLTSVTVIDPDLAETTTSLGVDPERYRIDHVDRVLRVTLD